MNENKLSFESENLVVDYFSLNVSDLEFEDIKPIVIYLSELGFN